MSKHLIILIAPILSVIAFTQQPNKAYPGEDRDPTGLLQQVMSARGVDRWSVNDLVMAPTRPPAQPVTAIAEWENARAVLFALDSDMLESFALNREVRTTNSAADVYDKKADLLELLTEVACKTSGSASDKASSAQDGSSDSEEESDDTKQEGDSGCEDGALESVTAERLFDKLAMAHDLIATIKGLTRYVDVVLLINSESSSDFTTRQLMDQLSAFNEAKEMLSSSHLFFVQARFDTKWIRDYGPEFIRAPQGTVISVDTRYDPESTSQHEDVNSLTRATLKLLGPVVPRSERAALEEMKSESDKHDSRLHDDEFPTLFATRLRQRDGTSLRRYPMSVVRPPIVLPGGDFLTDGQGNGFISTRTLRDNGGNVEFLDLNLKKYFGIDNVVYLHALPGETVKHIDMFLHVVSPNVLLLGKFSRLPNDPSEARLQNAAATALEDNLNIIRDHYQKLGRTVHVIDSDNPKIDAKAINIVRIPMPPVARPFGIILETATKEFNAAKRDYREHSNLLSLLSRFDTQQESFEQHELGLKELQQEESVDHPADEHDLELIECLRTNCDEIVKILTRYSGLSGEYHMDRDQIKVAADKLRGLLDALKESARKSESAEKALDGDQLITTLAGVVEFAKIARGFRDKVQGDIQKDEGLENSSALRLLVSASKMQKVVNTYDYGTDLYRTYLNLLQVHTSKSLVIAVPTYRDSTLHSDELAALKRIEQSFRQAYGDLTVIPVPSDAFIKELGSIHCLTKVVPEEVGLLTSQRNQADSEESK